MKDLLPAAALCVLVSSCASIEGPPSFEANANAASMYLYRGVPLVDAMVLQPDVTVSLSAPDDATVSVGLWADVPLSNDSGDGIYPDGNGGKFDQIDLWTSYARTFGATSMEFGVAGYQLPNGVGGTTNELFITAGWDLWNLSPSVTVWYDFDEVEGAYVNGSLSRGFEIDETTSAEVGVGLGVADSAQGLALYGLEASGVGDASFKASLSREWNDVTTISLSFNYSTIIDSDYEDALSPSVETDNAWIMLGIGWSY